MHKIGHAHSVEVYYQSKLVGGVYGVAIGGFFAGESMFSEVSNASTMALMFLMQHLAKRGFELFDSQVLTPHTTSLGAVDVSRSKYLQRLKNAIAIKTSF